MKNKCRGDSLYTIYKPHADILTSYFLLGDPDGDFLTITKNIWTIIDSLGKCLVKYTDSKCSLSHQGDP